MLPRAGVRVVLVQRSGLIEDMREDYTADGEEGLTAVCTMRRRPWPTPITRRFSMAMAEEAGLTRKEGPWQTYPRRMLMMRARSWALRDGFADVLRGLSLREEVEDYDGVAAQLPGPEPVRAAEGRASPSRYPNTRPRFADYIRPCTAPGTGRSRLPSADCREGQVIADEGESAARAASAVGPAMAAAAEAGAKSSDRKPQPPITTKIAHPSESRAQIADSQITGLSNERGCEGTEPIAISSDIDGRQARTTLAPPAYALIDAEGGAIEIETLEGLREAFGRLFSDSHLSAAQVLGLWESNEIARDEIAAAFGDAVLGEADHRRLKAEQETTERGTTKHTPLSRPITPAASPRRRNSKLRSFRPDMRYQLELGASSSNEELFETYRSRLLRLKRRRAKASTFADFREANRAIEKRLREHLPDLIVEIDATYAWAARHAG